MPLLDVQELFTPMLQASGKKERWTSSRKVLQTFMPNIVDAIETERPNRLPSVQIYVVMFEDRGAMVFDNEHDAVHYAVGNLSLSSKVVRFSGDLVLTVVPEKPST